MTAADLDSWEERLAALWASFDDYDEADFRRAIDTLVAELPEGSAIGMFERACAADSTGLEAVAVDLYQRALAAGLDGLRRRRTAIQLASSLRNVGKAREAVVLLTAEREAVSDELDDALTATLALCLTDSGREREAVSILLTALVPYLPRYQRSMGNYAKALLEEPEPS
jgi:hypothetical protein